jgi:cholest-4-en-3-one 26-monooxygenase
MKGRPLTLDEVDITDTARYAQRGYPWAEWDLLRREAPVYWYERPHYAPFWAITRHADIQEISRRSDVFVNSGRLRLATIEEDENMQRSALRRAEKLGWDPREPMDMVFMDDPRHRRFRLLVAHAFTPAALRRLERHLDEMSERFAAEFRERLRQDTRSRGACDFVREFAVKLPLATICQMMGLPVDDWYRLLTLTNALLGDVHPDYRRPGEDFIHVQNRAFGELLAYMGALVEQRRARPGDDLASELVAARVDDEPLTDQQLQGYLQLLLGAGNETTRNATAGGVEALLRHPEQRDRLCAQPELLDSAVEEILRWTSPVVQFARTAVEDFELRGVRIRAGQDVGMFYPSANRDEEVFEDPYRFDIARSPNHHLAFGGYGAHFCLGANLARWELRSAFRALLPILPEMELAGPAQRIAHLHVPGYHDLPVRHAPARATRAA